MKCSEIIEVCKKLAPEEWACSWDNPGLLAGRMEKNVERIYIALDATDQVVEDAAAKGADLLLTHHPLIFQAIKKVNDQNFITRRLVKLLQADMCCYAMHTNFDAAPGCMADLAAERLGLTECVPLEVMGSVEGPKGEIPYGIGKCGILKEKMTVKQLGDLVKEAFGIPFALMYGDWMMDRLISRVSVCPGAGGSEIEAALAWGAEALVTGDIGHHQGIDGAAQGIAVIDGGHYGLEHLFIPYMADYLRKNLGEQIEIFQAPVQWPAVLL